MRAVLHRWWRRVCGRSSVPSMFLRENPAYARFSIGEHSYGYPRVIGDPANATLRMGKFCSIADEVKIFIGAEHRVDWVTTYPFSVFERKFAHIAGHPHTKGDVVLGNDVWVGWGATILSGVTIGDGAVIGAESLVTRDVPPYAIVGGNPARVLRLRFSEEQVRALLELKWWDWDLDRIHAHMDLLLSDDIDGLLRRAGGMA